MPVTNSPSTLVGDFKNVYENSGLKDAIPQWAILQDRFPFSEEESTGQFFGVGIILARESGASYAPSSGANTTVTLNPSVAGYVGQALIEGYAIYMRSRVDYAAAAKASKQGKKAFASAYGAVIKNLKESHQFRLELSLLYGRDGLSIVDSNASGVLTMQAPSFAAGMWSGQIGAVLEAWTTVAASATQHNGDLTISTVNISTPSITVTGTNSSVVQGDILYFKGARTSTGYNETPGLYRILTNTGSLFNIDASVYDLWKSQSYAVGGNLSLTAIMQAGAIGMVYGLEKGLLLVNPGSFATLASDEAALRRFVSDTPNAKRGVKGITFILGSVEIEILAHPFVKPTHGMLVDESSFHRMGATDITMAMPGSGSEMEVHVTDQNALEIRSMSDMAVYSEKPAAMVLLTGITAS